MACYEADGGRFLAEIFKVEYLGKDEVKSDMQYGTIIVKNRTYHHYIYNVKDIDKGRPLIEKNDQLKLTGPLSSINCPSGYLRIEVDIFFGTYKEAFRVDWLPSDHDECFYDEKTIEVKDKGKISILFGMFYKAVEAKIEVRLLPKNHFSVHVVSVIAYHIKNDGQKTKFSSLLFSKPGGFEELIPLDRSIVVVPMGYQLLLDIELSTGITKTLKFDVNVDTEKNLLEGDKNYDIKGKVIWNPIHETDEDVNESCYYSDEYCEH